MYQHEIEILNRAHKKLTTIGWRRGQVKYWGNFTPRCLLQTFDTIQAEDDRIGKPTVATQRVIDRIETLMREFIMDHENPFELQKFAIIPDDAASVSLVEWNDWKYRKVSEVLELIDCCLSYYMSEQENPDTMVFDR